MASGIDASKYIDVSYTGNVFSYLQDQTNTLILHGPEAVKNVMKLYLMSQKGDYRRNISKGGPMIAMIGKPLSDAYKATIEKNIADALSIYSSIVVTKVDAVADTENKRWVVRVSFTDVYNKLSSSMTLGIPGVV
jgi:phage baseplate assembly protein W